MAASGFPYYLADSDPIFEYFFTVRDTKVIDRLTMPVSFQIRSKVPAQPPAGVGTLIFRYHKRMIFDWMRAQINAGINAWRALESFYEVYDIEDSDYDINNMYREWLRFSRPQSRANPAPEAAPVIVPRITRGDVDMAMEYIVATHIEDFITQAEGKFNYFLYRGIYYYLLRHHARLSISDVVKIAASPRTTVWYHIRTARELINVRPDLHASCRNAFTSG